MVGSRRIILRGKLFMPCCAPYRIVLSAHAVHAERVAFQRLRISTPSYHDGIRKVVYPVSRAVYVRTANGGLTQESAGKRPSYLISVRPRERGATATRSNKFGACKRLPLG